MLINMVGGGRAGGSINDSFNFTVVGGTSFPGSPQENTIFVDTSTNITGWCMGWSLPDSPENGTVFLSEVSLSGVHFNAVKNNGLWLYLSSCMQYINNEWVTKTAYIYQKGAWIPFKTYLYKNGEEFADITGGWNITNKSASNSIKNADHILMRDSGNQNRGSILKSRDLIDVSASTLLCMTMSFTSSDSPTFGLTDKTTNDVDTFSNLANYVAYVREACTANTTKTLKVDVSELTGSYYVLYYKALANGSITEIWLE